METIVAIPHRTEITVNYNRDENLVSIISDECPNITDPDVGTWQELKISPAAIPGLKSALQKAYEHITKAD